MRISLRDRAWMPFHTVRSVGPVRTPPVGRIRELLIKLRGVDPGHPLLCRLGEQRGRQYPVGADDLDAYLSAVIIDALPDSTPADLARLLQAIPLDGLPFVIAISDRAAAMRSAHVIGDTSTANPWFFGLLRADDPDRALALITGSRSARFPLGSAVINQFGRDPRRAVRALRRALPLGPPKITSQPPGDRRPVRTKIELGVPELATATAPPAVEVGLRQWRTTYAPSASMAAVWMSASVRALRANGIDTGNGVFTMMNCRRYLPSGAAVSGNFAVGPYLAPADLADPNDLGAELSAAAAEGVPLVLLSAITARSALRCGRPGRMPNTVDQGARPKINLSYFGGISSGELDWAVTDREQGAEYIVGAEPAGPQGITYVFARSPYGMHLSATAHPDFVDVPALRSALQDVAADPVGLLGGFQPYGPDINAVRDERAEGMNAVRE